MSTANPPRILVIANRTASTPIMLDTIAERAHAGASFTLLIPPDHGHQDDWSQELALELVGRATAATWRAWTPGMIPSTRSTARSPTASSTS